MPLKHVEGFEFL